MKNGVAQRFASIIRYSPGPPELFRRVCSFKLCLHHDLLSRLGCKPSQVFAGRQGPRQVCVAFAVNSLLSCWQQHGPCVAGMAVVNMVYTHRVKDFQEQSEGEPSALLIPALLYQQVTPMLS